MAILSRAAEINFKTSSSLLQAKNILSPGFALVIFIISSNDSSEKNLPTGPFADKFFSFSKVKYAKPDAPSSLAHLSILSKKLRGLSLVFFVTIALTIDPEFTNFLKISNFTSSLLKIEVRSFISKGFLRSGLSVPYFINASLNFILGNFSKSNFFLENFLKSFTINFSTTSNTSSCSTKDISKSN